MRNPQRVLQGLFVKMLAQPTPSPSARAASQRFCTAHAAVARSMVGMCVRPITASPLRERSQVMPQIDRHFEDACSLSWLYSSLHRPGTWPPPRHWLARKPPHAPLYGGRANQQEIPRLHETHRGRMVPPPSDARQRPSSTGSGKELPAHVAAG